MSWRKTILPTLSHLPDETRNRTMALVAEENDLAESLGFKCRPDDKRDLGWCRFHKDRTQVWLADAGWMRAFLDDADTFVNQRIYHTLSQALKDENHHARLKDGVVVPITGAAE